MLDVLNHGRGADFKSALGRAVHAAFEVADRMWNQSIACKILHGGWRSKPVDGLYTILRAASAFTGPELHLATVDEEVFAVARTVVGS